MNTDHKDKRGIINKMKNMCLPRPPREPIGESDGSVQSNRSQVQGSKFRVKDKEGIKDPKLS
jgi:hypothetical protein